MTDCAQTDPIAIATETYWIGDRPPGQLLYCNSYVRRFPGDETYDLLVDPASTCDFQVVLHKLEALLGSVAAVDAIAINHQDPDISASVAALLQGELEGRPILASDDTGELIHNYHDVPEEQFVSLEDYPSGLTLPSGQTLYPIFAPFGHHRGATMLFEPQCGVLFSGDLFSSLSNPDPEEPASLYFKDDNLRDLKAFHQIHMPTQAVMEQAIAAIEDLPAPLKLIAPQHGALITEDHFDAVFDTLRHLAVGVDLLDASPLDEEDRRWEALWQTLCEDMPSTPPAALQGSTRREFESALRQWTDALATEAVPQLQYAAIVGAHQRDLPTPRVTVDETRAKIERRDLPSSEDHFRAL